METSWENSICITGRTCLCEMTPYSMAVIRPCRAITRPPDSHEMWIMPSKIPLCASFLSFMKLVYLLQKRKSKRQVYFGVLMQNVLAYIHCSIGWFYEWISHRICKEKLGRKHCGALLSFRPWHLLNKPVVNHVDLGQNTSLAVSPYVPLSKVFTLKVCLRVCRPHSSCVHQPITKYKKKEVKRRGSSICDTKSTTEKNECVIVEYSLCPDSSVTVAVGHKNIENSL